jgi:hypothetical protein
MLNINLFSKINQIVKPNKLIIFENNLEYIKILNTGIYIINLSALITPVGELILYKNNNIEIDSLTSNYHNVIKLFKDDELYIKNNNSNSINCNNINFNIISISLYKN